jgi:hypothetical protein
MSEFSVDKHKIMKDIILLERLFLTGDEIYIQSYDPVNGRPQLVFSKNREVLGKLTASLYWDLKTKEIIKQ